MRKRSRDEAVRLLSVLSSISNINMRYRQNVHSKMLHFLHHIIVKNVRAGQVNLNVL